MEDGKTLYVAEMTAKKVVVADTESLKVTKVVSLQGDHTTGAGTSMSMSPDGKTLAFVSDRNAPKSEGKKKRKPLAEVAHREQFGHPFEEA